MKKENKLEHFVCFGLIWRVGGSMFSPNMQNRQEVYGVVYVYNVYATGGKTLEKTWWTIHGLLKTRKYLMGDPWFAQDSRKNLVGNTWFTQDSRKNLLGIHSFLEV